MKYKEHNNYIIGSITDVLLCVSIFMLVVSLSGYFNYSFASVKWGALAILFLITDYKRLLFKIDRLFVGTIIFVMYAGLLDVIMPHTSFISLSILSTVTISYLIAIKADSTSRYKLILLSIIGGAICSSWYFIQSPDTVLLGDINANAFGRMMYFSTIAAWILLILSKSFLLKFFTAATILLFYIVLFLVGSRQSFIVSSLFIITYLILSIKINAKSLFLAIILICLFCLGWYYVTTYFADAYLIQRFISNSAELGEGDAERIHIVKSALSLLLNKPICGYGIGTFQFYDGGTVGYTHNTFIEVLFSTGVIGFILYFKPLIKKFTKVIHINRSHKNNKPIKITLAFLVSYFTGCLFTVMYYSPLGNILLFTTVIYLNNCNKKQ